MKYLLIEADGNIKSVVTTNFSESLRDAIGGWFDAITVRGPDDTVMVGYVHDEGHLIGLPINVVATAMFGRVIAGPVVVVSGTSPTGDYDGESYPPTERMVEVAAWAAYPLGLRPEQALSE